MQSHEISHRELADPDQRARLILDLATKQSIERSSEFPDAIKRIGNALERRFYPYVLENETIADQLSSPEYSRFVDEIREFLGARVGFVICPDGRIIAVSLIDPRVASVHRKLQGLPEVRPSTRDYTKMVLDDPDLAASIVSGFQTSKSLNPELVEFTGPHIHSQHPEHGCGACVAKIQRGGRTPELGMKLGGIAEYFEELGDGFYAFDNVATDNGAKGTTFDLTYDTNTQGFIIGLRGTYKKFDPEQSLPENLNRLAREGSILITDESLIDSFRQSIIDKAKNLGVEGNIDIRKYQELGKNLILIGTIAKELTLEEQEKGLKWIPSHLIEGKSDTAKRVLAYHVLRNMVYRVLSGIESGRHPLLQHPEQLIRIGPIGADFNVQNIPFIQSMPGGRVRPEDRDGVRALYNLSYGVLREQGVDLTSEGRVILVTGSYDRDRYGDPTVALEEFNKVKSMVMNNSAWIRLSYKESVATGETVVIGCIHEPGTRKLTQVV